MAGSFIIGGQKCLPYPSQLQQTMLLQLFTQGIAV